MFKEGDVVITKPGSNFIKIENDKRYTIVSITNSEFLTFKEFPKSCYLESDFELDCCYYRTKKINKIKERICLKKVML